MPSPPVALFLFRMRSLRPNREAREARLGPPQDKVGLMGRGGSPKFSQSSDMTDSMPTKAGPHSAGAAG